MGELAELGLVVLGGFGAAGLLALWIQVAWWAAYTPPDVEDVMGDVVAVPAFDLFFVGRIPAGAVDRAVALLWVAGVCDVVVLRPQGCEGAGAGEGWRDVYVVADHQRLVAAAVLGEAVRQYQRMVGRPWVHGGGSRVVADYDFEAWSRREWPEESEK